MSDKIHIIKDVTVKRNFKTQSDNWIIRANIQIYFKKERSKMTDIGVYKETRWKEQEQTV